MADCEVCDVPMVVWQHHGDRAARGRASSTCSPHWPVADARLGPGHWSVDRVMRQIPDHFHAHARDPHWWFRRFGALADRRPCRW